MTPALISLLLATLPGFSVRLTDDDPPRAERWLGDVIGYRMQLLGSDDIAPDAALGAVRAAFASWQALPCATIAFEELGDAPDPSATMAVTAGPDGHNDVVWVEDASWPFGAYVLGVTAPALDREGYLEEADIAFNGLHVQWTTSGNGGMDLESVAVHEIGHFIGIQHNLGPFLLTAPPTMAPVVAGGIQNRSLEPDDRAAACFLYPSTSWRCLSDADCPLLLSQTFESNDFYSGRLRCDRATETCSVLERFVAAGVGFGEICHRPEECAAGLGCHAYGDAGVCTSGCDPFAAAGAPGACRAGYRCQGFAAPLETAGVCLPEDGVVLAPGEGPDGCLASTACGPGRVCVPLPTGELRRCASLCKVADGDADCAAGERCWSYGQPNGACFDAAAFPPEAMPLPLPAPLLEDPPEPLPEPAVEDDDAEAMADADAGAEIGGGREDGGCGGARTGLGLGVALAALGVVMQRRRGARVR